MNVSFRRIIEESGISPPGPYERRDIFEILFPSHSISTQELSFENAPWSVSPFPFVLLETPHHTSSREKNFSLYKIVI